MVDTLPPNNIDALERAAVYGLLGRLWLREIDASTRDELADEQVLSLLDEYGIATTLLRENQIDPLAIDYCRIFLGPQDHVLPLQSVTINGLLNGAPVDSMREYLQYIHIPVAEYQMLDHLGFQMQVMQAILNSFFSPEDLPSKLDLAASFFRDHIAWGQQITAPAARRAQTDFYKTTIELTADFLQSESVNSVSQQE